MILHMLDYVDVTILVVKVITFRHTFSPWELMKGDHISLGGKIPHFIAWANNFFNTSGSQFNIKMISYQSRKSHCGDKTILRLSYLHNGFTYAGKMTSLYWIRALIVEYTWKTKRPDSKDLQIDISQILIPQEHIGVMSNRYQSDGLSYLGRRNVMAADALAPCIARHKTIAQMLTC